MMTTKVSMDISSEFLDQLQALKTTPESDLVNVFRQALGLYKLAREEENNGGRIIVEDKKGNQKQVIIT